MSSQLAVFGNPICHSLSPLIHRHFALQCSETEGVSYDKILVENPQSFSEQVSAFFAQGARGCNVTVPCKFAAFACSTEQSPRALRARAANTLIALRNEQGQLTGIRADNTDGVGFMFDLQRLHCPLENASVLLIGAGGAAYGIAPYLLESPLASLTIVNRTKAKAEELKVHLTETMGVERASNVQVASFDELKSDVGFTVIINASSSSLKKEVPPLAYDMLKNTLFVYDLFYTPTGNTLFTLKTKEFGISDSFDGLGMLVGQAAFSWEQWFGFKPDVEATLAYVRQELQNREKAKMMQELESHRL